MMGKDNQTAARYLIYKLKHLRLALPSEAQIGLATELTSIGQKQPGSLALDMVGIPYLANMVPQRFVTNRFTLSIRCILFLLL